MFRLARTQTYMLRLTDMLNTRSLIYYLMAEQFCLVNTAAERRNISR